MNAIIISEPLSLLPDGPKPPAELVSQTSEIAAQARALGTHVSIPSSCPVSFLRTRTPGSR